MFEAAGRNLILYIYIPIYGLPLALMGDFVLGHGWGQQLALTTMHNFPFNTLAPVLYEMHPGDVVV